MAVPAQRQPQAPGHRRFPAAPAVPANRAASSSKARSARH